MLKYLSYITSVFLFFLLTVSNAQQKYGNEWIDFSKEYYKIPIGEDGFYKLTYNDLINENIPINTIDPRSLKLYFRGEECAIEVEGEQDGTFNTSDFVRFYGVKNRGGFEKEFSLADTVANPYYALYTDTTAFFLTWGGISGKRITKTGIPNTINATSIFPQEELLQVFSNNFSQGNEPITSVNRSEYDEGDGWMSSIISKNTNEIHYTGGFSSIETNGNVELEIRLVGRNSFDHNVQLLLNDNDYGILGGFDQQEGKTFKVNVNTSDVVNGNLSIKFKLLGADENADAISIAYMKLNHFVSEVSNSQSNYILSTTTTNIQLPIASDVTQEFYDITDVYNIKLLSTTKQGSNVFLKLNKVGQSNVLIKKQEATPTFAKAEFIEESASDYMIVSNKRYETSVDAYEVYRESATGGGFTVSKAYVDRLFNQYAYGERVPYAINNYCRFMYDNYKPKYFLLIGKPSELRAFNGSKTIRKNTFDLDENGKLLFEDYVFTGGQPGSDYIYTMGLNPDEPYVQAIATGRISGYTNEEVLTYLEKVKEYEAIGAGAEWQKNFIHISGGKTALEQRVFKDYVTNYAKTIEGKLLGGTATLFHKETAEELVFFNVSEQVNKGAGFITYIGHSASNFTEIDIGDVTNEALGYNNKGKYPFLIFNGCQAGFIFFEESYIENWMFAKDKGAIGGMAHTAFGYTTRLHRYTTQFYETYFTDSTYFEESFGNVLIEVARKISLTNPSNINQTDITQLQQFQFLGDPAIKYFPASKPDYTIKTGNVDIVQLTEPITSVVDSFQLQIVVNNLGRVIDDSVEVCVTRVYDEGKKSIELPSMKIPTVFLSDTIYYTLYNDIDNFVGNNSFVVSIDCAGEIDELDELNNSQVFDYYLPSNGVYLRAPFEFEVVGNDTVLLVVESADRNLELTNNFEIQIDTNYDFSSPFKEISTSGGVAISEELVLPYLQDSLVYFWRARLKADASIWVESSFMYIKNQKGWGQGHAHQFRKNTLNGVTIPQKKWGFSESITSIEVMSSGNGVPDYNKKVRLIVNNQAYMVEATANWNDFCVLNGVYALTFDRESGLPFHYNNLGRCGLDPRVMDNFTMSSVADRSRFNSYIENTDDGDGILLYTGGNARFSQWEDSLKTKLKDLGAIEIDSVKDGEPYILLVKKGEGVIFEKRGADSTITLNEKMSFNGLQGEGSVVSTLIGPVVNSSELIMQSSKENSDTVSYSVISDDQAFEKEYSSNVTYQTDNFVKDDFDYISLHWRAKDTVLSAPQLNRWVLLFDPVAEGVLLSKGGKDVSSEVNQGDTFALSSQFINVTAQNFSDSITVTLTVIGGTDFQKNIYEQKYSALRGFDTLGILFEIPTNLLTGDYQLTLEANSEKVLEQSYQNNILTFKLKVKDDEINPLLDITFDGRQILSGDIVAPSPFVVVSMRDENKILYKSDTTGWFLSLKKVCDDCEFEPIYFTSDVVKSWTPATKSTDFRVEMQFNELSDGDYVLRVQGTDGAGNKANEEPLEVGFKVINESAVTHFYPYPNPFSTNCKFVFTLTGSEVPEKLLIRIMTVSGIVVREINQDELGGIHIGNNITPYSWDGTDQFGDRLANGVYLYQVFIDGKDDDTFKHRETSADKAFHRGWGKLYILR